MRAYAVLAALLLAGCTGGTEVVRADDPPAPAASEPHGELTCDSATQAGIDETIDGQLEALAAGDYAAALGFSSEGFRTANTPEQFQATIEDEYPLLVGADGHTSSYCVARGDEAQVLVTIDGAGDTMDELVYGMAREGEAWRIATAGRVRPASEEPIEV